MSSGEIIPLLSTSISLGINPSWTSPGYSTRTVDKLNIILQSDTKGTLTVNWSADEENTYSYTETYYVDGGAEMSIPISLKATTIQLIYNNVAPPQTSFYLYTYGTTSVANNSYINSLIDSLVLYDSIAFDLQQPAFTSDFVNPLPQNFIPKPTIDSYIDANPTEHIWKIENSSFSLYPLQNNSLTIPSFSMIWGQKVTPGSSINVVEFQATYNGFPDSPTGATATTYDSIGYGLPTEVPMTGNAAVIRSGIVLGNITPYGWTAGGGYGNMAITTYSSTNATVPGVPVSIPQNNWDDPIPWVNWTEENNFRFIITPSETICQIKTVSATWKTFHTIQTNFLTLCNTNSGRLIMLSETLSDTTIQAGCSCQSYYTYIQPPPTVVDNRSINGSSIHNTESVLVDLYNNANTVIGQGDIIVNLNYLSICNTDSSNATFVNIYRNTTVTGGSYTALSTSPVYYNTTASISDYPNWILQRTYIVAPSTEINVNLKDIFIQPGYHCTFTAKTNSGSGHLFYGLNWNEIQ